MGNKWIIIILFKSFMKGIVVVRIQIFAYMYIPHDCVISIYIFIYSHINIYIYIHSFHGIYRTYISNRLLEGTYTFHV